MSQRASNERGVTLTELMVVVIIIGILGVAATIGIKSNPAHEAARTVTELLGKTRRLAITGGPVSASVVAATGETARARLEVSTDVSTGTAMQILRVYTLKETGPATAVWQQEMQITLAPNMEIWGLSDVATSLSGGALPATLGAATKSKKFYPDGTAEAQTWYIQRRNTDKGDRYRVWVMPLSGIAAMEKTW